MDTLREELRAELKKYYGEQAEYREGQEDAIYGVLKGDRTLVVQKTGWGKSLVYFMATKMLRKQHDGFALIISPLLVLMDNQIDSAMKLGLNVRTINSANQEEWSDILKELNQNRVDALLISPERLANQEFKEQVIDRMSAKILLFVVDEAHCISDWGHDFRPDYRRIVDIISLLPPNIPFLATTATANNRVVEDIKTQLGDNLKISRGKLLRESLAIQVKKLDTIEERLVWLSKVIPELPGTGIIYCLTINDCSLVSRWLNQHDIKSEIFHSRIEETEGKVKKEITERFQRNEIKVLVATVAFGMGYDKPDISFVIHFQKPANLVAYYQQIGRAGRGIDKAYAILLCGAEDDKINTYFINSAFPTESLMNEVINTLIQHPGLKRDDFGQYINMSGSKITACLKYLSVNGDIFQADKRYYKSARPWNANMEKSNAITKMRMDELESMNEFTRLTECYMKHLALSLDDSDVMECGRCANCTGKALVDADITGPELDLARKFVREDYGVISPRKQWPAGIQRDGKRKILPEYMCEDGLVLSKYGDAGWGRMVADGKYEKDYFDEDLVEASANTLKSFIKENQISWVTNIPSLKRPLLVKGFAERLAAKLGLTYHDALKKVKNNDAQKNMHNSYRQCMNAMDSFGTIDGDVLPPGNALLVDDMVDSRWTFTVCGYLLRKKGSGKVYPYALASTTNGSGEDS